MSDFKTFTPMCSVKQQDGTNTFVVQVEHFVNIEGKIESLSVQATVIGEKGIPNVMSDLFCEIIQLAKHVGVLPFVEKTEFGHTIDLFSEETF
jgi:hypothetical protein